MVHTLKDTLNFQKRDFNDNAPPNAKIILQKQPMEQSTTSLSGYQKLAVGLLALTQFTVVLDFMVMSPLGDSLIKSLKITPVQFGWVVSSYAFSAGVSGLLTAGFADRFDRKKLLLFFYIGFIVGTLFCGLANSYEAIIAARILTGLFGGVIGSISMAIITDLFTLQQRGRVMGIVQMGFGASQVLGIPISLYLANIWGWKSPFMMIVGLSTLLALVIMQAMKPVTKHLELQNDRNAFSHLWHTVAKRNYRIGFLATALLSIGGFMMMPFGSVFAINNLHVTPAQLPFIFMVSGVGSLIIMPLIGRLSDKVDKFKLFSGASIWMVIMILIYTNLPAVPLWMIILFNVLMMMGIMSRMIPATTLTTAIPVMQDRGAFMSINSSLQQIAGGIASFVAGMIVVQKNNSGPLEHYNTLGLVASGISILCIYMVYRVSQLTIKTPIPFPQNEKV
ncbi:major facilitator superfamily MFS_1 [Runella slithyformis DSM 19594]|uniref:Major facilitator superfamily MFS_1 n=2 Tax=Runella TaxID=105 RepID=A0A7U3ZP42_RUNSL|nr:major facilitator superfamily MFS_1 [Runella slithyformis DSM 19594]